MREVAMAGFLSHTYQPYNVVVYVREIERRGIQKGIGACGGLGLHLPHSRRGGGGGYIEGITRASRSTCTPRKH